MSSVKDVAGRKERSAVTLLLATLSGGGVESGGEAVSLPLGERRDDFAPGGRKENDSGG